MPISSTYNIFTDSYVLTFLLKKTPFPNPMHGILVIQGGGGGVTGFDGKQRFWCSKAKV
jgi:hypothetical protein